MNWTGNPLIYGAIVKVFGNMSVQRENKKKKNYRLECGSKLRLM